jgi:hypothetical protein
VYFAGVIQPALQMFSVFMIAYAPVSILHRHRLITIQELTCKVPFSTVLVEAYLLISFSFSLKYNYETASVLGRSKIFVNDGDVVIKAYIGLLLFMTSNMVFLLIVNVLRREHNRQCEEQVKGERLNGVFESNDDDDDDDYDDDDVKTMSQNQSSIIRPQFNFFENDNNVDDEIIAAGDAGIMNKFNVHKGSGTVSLADSSQVYNNNSNSGGGVDNNRANKEMKRLLQEDDDNNVIIGPCRKRSAKLRGSTIAVGVIFIFSLLYLIKYPCINFRYRGIASPYIYHLEGAEYVKNHTEVNFDLNLYETTTQLVPDLLPKSYAVYFTVCALLLFIIDPLILALLCLFNAALPDRMMKLRRRLCRFIDIFQCWSGPEVIFIAT